MTHYKALYIHNPQKFNPLLAPRLCYTTPYFFDAEDLEEAISLARKEKQRRRDDTVIVTLGKIIEDPHGKKPKTVVEGRGHESYFPFSK